MVATGEDIAVQAAPLLTDAHRSLFNENGYVVVPRVFPADEVNRLRDHFMDLRAKAAYPGDFAGVSSQSTDSGSTKTASPSSNSSPTATAIEKTTSN